MCTIRLRFHIAATAAIVLSLAVGSMTPAHAFSPSTKADSSKLATGKWVKIKVTTSGIHAITASDIKKWGLSDLSKVHVFGFGGAPVSEKLTSDIPDDLPEVPILRNNDKILFYAQGPTTWRTQNGDVNFVQVQHPYATAGYYFVTDDSRYSDVTVAKSSTPLNGATTINTFTERLFHEEELVNPGQTGRALLGEDFRYSNSQAFKFTLDGLVEGSKVAVLTNFAAKSVNGANKVSFQYNGINLPSTDRNKIPAVTDAPHTHYITSQTTDTFRLAQTNALTYNVNFSTSGTLYLARLNYITVNYQRNLALNNGYIAWGQYQEQASAIYQVAGSSGNTRIWDVTSVTAPVEMNATLEGGIASFSPIAPGRREYIAFNDNGNYPSPEMDSNVSNQNIHGEPTPDMIIISPTEYLSQAMRVAKMHESVDSMRVLVVDQKKVFNEFSSGTPDAMAYRMISKLFYDRGADAQGHKLGYLMLLGNGTFDNRQLSSAVKAISYPALLTWQTEESSNENSSYTSDDPYAVLQDNSGPRFDHYDLDIAVGRFPVRSVGEARTAVDKLIKYVTVPDNGSWKNNFLDIADDEEHADFMKQADGTIDLSRKNGGQDFIYNKVYMDAFTAQSQGTGRFYPDARSKMFRLLDEGVVWWNYTGHAGPFAWTGEGMLSRTDVAEKLFYRHLPILYAATCEFTRHDALETSSGESMFLNAQGGAIALVCPPRLVYIGPNATLHDHVARQLFKRDAQGRVRKLGDVLRLSKNAYRQATSSQAEDNNTRYFLYGDPAMRPSFPTCRIKINTINGEAVNAQNMPIFQARQTLTFAGEVVDEKGNKINFNGPVIATLYDCEESIVTHGYGEKGKEYTFLDRNNKLAVKVDTVNQGSFSFKMTIPSEIVATYDNFSPSLLNLYAYDNSSSNRNLFNGGSREAMGSNSDFYIYGYDETVVADTIGPEITYLGLNSENFKDGENVNESPLVIASMTDASGINLSTSGIGHAITLTLDENKVYNDVGSYFTPTLSNGSDTQSSGTVSYQLKDLGNGHHTLKLKVWDVFNNSSEKAVTFNVMRGLKPDLLDVYTDANPASVEANFFIKHNRPDATLTVKIEIYDLLGREVWSTVQTGRSDLFTTFPINWNLTDKSGSRVQRGIYVYRASISSDGVQESTKAKKIAVTAQ